MRLSTVAVVLSLSLAAPASAQVPSWVTDLIAAAELPVVALEARRDGVPDAEVRTAVMAMRDKNVRGHDARTVLVEARDARRANGPIDNFGAFVQTKLDAGLRGRELADAIRAEHVARGKGAGRPGADASKGSAGTKGKSPAASDTKGKSPAAGEARRDSGKAARPPQTGRGKRPPSDNR